MKEKFTSLPKVARFAIFSIGGFAVVCCSCLLLIMILPPSESSTTIVTESQVVATLSREEVNLTATPLVTETLQSKETSGTTNTIDPLITPPTNISTLTPTKTFTPRSTATITGTPTKTVTPIPSNTPLPSYVSILGKIWTGVKVYYGLGSDKAYGFEILGGSEECPSLPSGRGVLVVYPDNTEEWKDRDYLVSSGLFFVREDDPAITRLEWYVYSFCP